MSKRIVILASVFLTAGILVVIAAISTAVFAQKPAAAEEDAVMVETLQQREVEYTRALEQANQQLQQANEEMQKMKNEMDALRQNGPDGAGAAENQGSEMKVEVEAADAQSIAAAAADGNNVPLKDAELVDYEGTIAYEVVFEKGSIFVDAASGEVLFNGTVPRVISLDEASQIAADYMGSTEIVQFDEVTINRMPLYRVIFKTGHMVYLDKNGQILYVQLPGNGQQVTSGEGGGGGDDGGGYYDDDDNDDDHDDHDDDHDDYEHDD